MNLLQKLEEKFLIAPKILYFIVNLQYYTLHQFRDAFAKKKFEVSDSQYGKMTGIVTFISFFTSIFIGRFSDKTGKQKTILLFLTIITAAVFLNFYIDSLMKPSIYIFWFFILLYLVFNNPKQPLLDKIILDYLTIMPSAGPKVYGKQRLWGTIAYFSATFLCEWCILDKKTNTYNFDNLIHYCLITTILAVLAIIFLIKNKNNTSTEEKESTSEKQNVNEQQNTTRSQLAGRTSGYMELLKNKEFLFFIFIIFSNAITRSAMSLYLNNFLRDVLHVKPYVLPSHWPSWLQFSVSLLNDKPSFNTNILWNSI